jgi:hypothetical protein
MLYTSSKAPVVSGSGRDVEYVADAGAHRPQISDLTLKKMSPDRLSTWEPYGAPLSNMVCFSRQGAP